MKYTSEKLSRQVNKKNCQAALTFLSRNFNLASKYILYFVRDKRRLLPKRKVVGKEKSTQSLYLRTYKVSHHSTVRIRFVGLNAKYSYRLQIGYAFRKCYYIWYVYIYILYTYMAISELLQQHKRICALLKSVNTGSGNGVLVDGTKPCHDMTDFRRPYKI